jgi:DNA-binding FrmR family transcriptional regulator
MSSWPPCAASRGRPRGISGIIEEGRYGPDIIPLLTAMSSAAREVSLLPLQDHIEGCVTDAIQHDHGEEMVRELIAVIRQAART